MFKPADHSRRMPVYLQPRTKENLVWQLAMLLLFVGGLNLWDEYQERQLDKKRDKYRKNPLYK